MTQEEIIKIATEAYLQGQKDLAGAIKEVLGQIESTMSDKIMSERIKEPK